MTLPIAPKNLLFAFLEKDNIKLLVFEISLTKKVVRQFAGQITFSPEVVKDAYIADPAKFSGQIKVAFSQKPALQQIREAVILLPPDKTFTKSYLGEDPPETFIQSLPYFQDELIVEAESARPKSRLSPQARFDFVTYVAFEKKLVEDLERPFLESGKTVIAVKSAVNLLASAFPNDGKYFLLTPFEKEIGVVAADSGKISSLASFPKDVFLTRFFEYIVNHNLGDTTRVFTVGVFAAEIAERLRTEKGMEVVSLETRDIYDLTAAVFTRAKASKIAEFLTAVAPLLKRLLGHRLLFLTAAALVGFSLVVLLVRGLILPTKPSGDKTPVSPVAQSAPPPAPEPNPADFKIRVLNGTLVTGEAAKLAEKLKEQSYDVGETKNATTAGFVTTRLRVDKTVPDKVTATLKTFLLEVYETVAIEPLEDQTVKIEIIIGRIKATP